MSDARRVFTYGTLAAPEVMAALVGQRPSAEPAILEGFARYTLRDRVYPGLVAEAGARTHGLLYAGIDAASLALLDRFEGSLYERRRLSVLGAAGRVLDAEVYVTAETCRHLLSDEPWDLDRFVSTHLDDWVHHCASLRRPSAADFPA